MAEMGERELWGTRGGREVRPQAHQNTRTYCVSLFLVSEMDGKVCVRQCVYLYMVVRHRFLSEVRLCFFRMREDEGLAFSRPSSDVMTISVLRFRGHG